MGKNQPLNYPYPLVLASTSKYRSALLAQLGFTFDCVSPGVDEDQFKDLSLSAKELSLKLSLEKAMAVFRQHSNSCVIGSDQVCMLDGNILSKPMTIENAIEQLERMQDKSHQLVTSVTLLYPEGKIQFFNETKLHMRQLNREQISAYVKKDLPLDCAGSYKLESFGLKLFHKIEMDDHTSIVGLPLIQLNNHLLQLGYPL